MVFFVSLVSRRAFLRRSRHAPGRRVPAKNEQTSKQTQTLIEVDRTNATKEN